MLKAVISLLLAFMPVVYRRCFSLSFYSLSSSYLHATYILVQTDIPIKKYFTDFYHFWVEFLQKKQGILTVGFCHLGHETTPCFFLWGGDQPMEMHGDFEGLSPLKSAFCLSSMGIHNLNFYGLISPILGLQNLKTLHVSWVFVV